MVALATAAEPVALAPAAEELGVVESACSVRLVCFVPDGGGSAGASVDKDLALGENIFKDLAKYIIFKHGKQGVLCEGRSAC